MVSKKLIDAVKVSRERDYKIAQEAGMHPSLLSQLINNIFNVKDGDERVIAIGKVVGVEAKDCFE